MKYIIFSDIHSNLEANESPGSGALLYVFISGEPTLDTKVEKR